MCEQEMCECIYMYACEKGDLCCMRLLMRCGFQKYMCEGDMAFYVHKCVSEKGI